MSCKTYICNPTTLGVLGFIIMIFIVRYQKSLNKIFGGTKDCALCYNWQGGSLSNWQGTHFLLFMIGGIICPDNFKTFLFMGILWEIIELTIEYQEKRNEKHTLCKHTNNCSNITMSKSEFWKAYFGKTKSDSLYYCSQGFYGQLLDVTCNSLGYLLGIYLHKHVFWT
jgi:hypothetical protein